MSAAAKHRKPCSRRELLRIGALAPFGLGLGNLLASEAERAASSRFRPARSCILIFLEGGPSHVDLWDMKPNAPAEVRGEFRPIRTRVPGVVVCEHLPRLAQQIHHLAQVRSVTHQITDHNACTYFALTGKYPVDGNRLVVRDEPANFPPFGAVLARLRPSNSGLPDFVHVPEVMSNLNVNIAGSPGRRGQDGSGAGGSRALRRSKGHSHRHPQLEPGMRARLAVEWIRRRPSRGRLRPKAA